MREAEEESWKEVEALAEADDEKASAQAVPEPRLPAHPVPSMESSNMTMSPGHDSDVQVVEGDSQVIESLPSTPGNASAHNGHGVGGGLQQDQILHLLSIVKMKMPLILQQKKYNLSCGTHQIFYRVVLLSYR